MQVTTLKYFLSFLFSHMLISTIKNGALYEITTRCICVPRERNPTPIAATPQLPPHRIFCLRVERRVQGPAIPVVALGLTLSISLWHKFTRCTVRNLNKIMWPSYYLFYSNAAKLKNVLKLYPEMANKRSCKNM